MFGQIPPTEFDLRFSVFGIPVRVHPIFWLSSAFLAWDRVDPDPRRIVIRILCIFLAITVHELGHALVTKRFGWYPEIVLYFFGGYATSARHSTWKDIAVSAAGPGAGFVLFGITWFTAFELTRQQIPVNDLVRDAINFSLFINLIWNAVNLLPVLPLDGGQISRELCLWLSPRRGMQASLILSLVVAGGIAVLAFQRRANNTGLFGLDPLFLGIMFAYLAYQSYQGLDAARRGYR